MRFVPPERWPRVLLLAAGGGAVLGVICHYGQVPLSAAGLRPGLIVMPIVNLALPGLCIALAVWYPRVVTAWVGAVAAVGLFQLVTLVCKDWHVYLWTFGWMMANTSPIMLGVLIGSVALSLIAARSSQVVRRVGYPPRTHCIRCGYDKTGRPWAAVCPECGH